MILSSLVKVKATVRVRVTFVHLIKVIKNLMSPRVVHALPPQVKKESFDDTDLPSSPIL